MRPNLSVEKIAAALALLGTAALVSACGGADPKTPVSSKEVAPSSDKAATGDNHCGADKKHDNGQASCSAAKGAGSCGAKGDGSCGAKTATDTKATDPTAAGASGTDPKPADPKAADTKAADSKGATATPAPTTTGTGKKPAPPPGGGKKGGASGCGAGTCSAKK